MIAIVVVGVALIWLLFYVGVSGRRRTFASLRAAWVPHKAERLPQGFLPRGGEAVLFSGRARISLPAVQTSSYGFVAGFAAGTSDSKIVLGDAKSGWLVITTRRILIFAGANVREWPLAQVAAATGQVTLSATRLKLSISNVGVVVADLDLRACAHADAALAAATAETLPAWPIPSLS
jgi:hypothetical protein